MSSTSRLTSGTASARRFRRRQAPPGRPAEDACLCDAVKLVRREQPPLKLGSHLTAPVNSVKNVRLLDDLTIQIA
jgi:hypothetical protein